MSIVKEANIKTSHQFQESTVIPRILGSFCSIPNDYFSIERFNEARFGRISDQNFRVLVTVRRANGTALWTVQSPK